MVEVVALRGAVVGPGALLLVREGDTGLVVDRLGLGPAVPVAVRRLRVAACVVEPRVLVGGVVEHQVDEDADAAVGCCPYQLDEVADRAEPRVDAVEVGDVVAVVAARRGVERQQPQAGHAQAGQVVDPLGQPLQVADAVAVAVGERLDVDAVDDGVLPPQVTGHRRSHAPCLPAACGDQPPHRAVKSRDVALFALGDVVLPQATDLPESAATGP